MKNNQIDETPEDICECGHQKEYHRGTKKDGLSCYYPIDDDGESYGMCSCKKFKPKEAGK